MMVTGLQLPFQSSPLDGNPAKAQSLDPGPIPSLSFGEILKAKAKQLQEEVNPSSIAAALATLQTLPTAILSIPDMETSENTAKIDSQSGAPTNISALKALQINIPSCLDLFPQPATNRVGMIDQPEMAQTRTERSFADKSQNIQLGLPETVFGQPVPSENTQFVAMNLSKPIAEKTRVELRIPTIESTIETSNTTVALNATSEPENVAAEIKFQTPANKETSPKTLINNSSPSRVEPKDVKPAQTTVSQPIEISNYLQGDPVSRDMDIENVVDQLVSPFSDQTTGIKKTLPESFPVPVEVDQESISFAHAKAKSWINVPESEAKTPDTAPMQDPNLQAITSQESVNSASHQNDGPVSILITSRETAETTQATIPPAVEQAEQLAGSSASSGQSQASTSIRKSVAQPAIRQESASFASRQNEQLVSTNTSKVATSEDLPIQFSSNQIETTQKTRLSVSEQFENVTSKAAFQFASSEPALVDQTEQPMTPSVSQPAEKFDEESAFQRVAAISVQGSGNPFVINAEMLTHIPPREAGSPNLVTTETKESKIDVEIPVSSSISSFQLKEIESKEMEAQTASKVDVHATVVEARNDVLRAQAEISRSDYALEAKTAEINTEKPIETVLSSQIKTNQNIKINKVQAGVQPQQSESKSSDADLDFDQKIKEIPSETSVQTKEFAATSPQSEIKTTLSPVEPDDVNGIVDRSTVEIKLDETLRPNSIPESTDDVAETIGNQQVKTTVQTLPSEASFSIIDKNNNETDKIVQQAFPSAEVTVNLASESSPQIQISHPAMSSEDPAATRKTEVQGHRDLASVAEMVTKEEQNVTEPEDSVTQDAAATPNFSGTVEESVTPTPAGTELFNIDPTGFTQDTSIDERSTSKNVLAQTSTDDSAVATVDTVASSVDMHQPNGEVSADIENLPGSQTDHGASYVETPTRVNSEKIAVAPDESEADLMPFKTELEQSETPVETKTALPQDRATQSPSVVQAPTNTMDFAAETPIANEWNEAIHQPTTQQPGEPVLPVSPEEDALVAQTDVKQKDFISGIPSDKSQVAPSDVFAAGIPSVVVPVEETAIDQNNAKAKDLSEQSVIPTEMVEETAVEAQFSKSTFETLGLSRVESQVDIESTEVETPQLTTKPIEKAEINSGTHIATNSEGPKFIELNEISKNDHTTVEPESKTINDATPLTSISNSSNSSPSQLSASIKIEAGKQALRPKPAVSKNEEICSAEKQPKMSHISESSAASTGPLKETMTVEANGNKPAGQVNSQAAEVAQQVIRQINAKIKTGPTSMHLQLNPKELGNIDVEMVSTSQGVRVTFFAEQANTGKLLETQLNQLRESLIDSGVQLSGLNISQHGSSEQKGGFSHNTSLPQSSPRDFVQNETNYTEVSHPERTTGQLGEVDYRI